ncbi:MAG: hypothetical protein JOY69_07465 [Candidatus Eremiobacteraeota bacterium]|nr:hypothetical protein [Candidatus Eremiobacteraeota bacterium]
MAPVDDYRMTGRAAEIALARSAAPPSISDDAEILVLGTSGYETAVKGTNGFVCFVERSWTAGFDDPKFWDPKLRGPNCFNPAAVRTELPQILQRTKWVLAGITREQMMANTRKAFADGAFSSPEPGALSYMLSKQGYLDDVAGPWLPHMMFFVSSAQAKLWGAGLDGSPIIIGDPGGDSLGSTVLLVPVRRWSDGTPAPPPAQPMQH